MLLTADAGDELGLHRQLRGGQGSTEYALQVSYTYGRGDVLVRAESDAGWFDYRAPDAQFYVYLYNITRNVTFVAIIALGYVMNYAGLSLTIGLALAVSGFWFPAVAVLLGVIGNAVAGTNTASNALFGNLVAVAGQQASAPPVSSSRKNAAANVSTACAISASCATASRCACTNASTSAHRCS